MTQRLLLARSFLYLSLRLSHSRYGETEARQQQLSQESSHDEIQNGCLKTCTFDYECLMPHLRCISLLNRQLLFLLFLVHGQQCSGTMVVLGAIHGSAPGIQGAGPQT